MHTIRCGKHLFQVAFAVGESFPQVEVDAALAGGQLGQLLVDAAQHIAGKARLFGSCRGAHRRDGLHIDHAVVAQRFPQHVQHLAIVSQEAIRCAQRGEGVGAQQDIQLFRLGGGQHIQRHLLPAGGALDRTAVHDGVRAHAGVAADERPAQVDLIIREAHGQAVAQEGRIREVIQVHLAAAGLADDAGVIGLDGIGPGALLCRAKGLQRGGLRTGSAVRGGAVGSRFALHGQRGQNVGRNAAGVGGRGLVGTRRTVFQNGGDGVGQQQNGNKRAQQPQLSADTAVLCPARRGMIFV